MIAYFLLAVEALVLLCGPGEVLLSIDDCVAQLCAKERTETENNNDSRQ